MANISTDDITGYAQYLKSQGTPDSDIQGYTKYLADQHGVDHPSEENKSWLDTDIAGGTPRGYIQGALNTLPTAGMITGGVLGGGAGTVAEPGGGTIVGAVGGAALGGGLGESLKNLGEQYILGQNKTRSEIYGNPAQGVIEGAGAELGGRAIGKGLEAAAATGPGQYVLKKASQAPAWAAKKIGNVFASVAEDTTGRYIADRATINAAPETHEIADKLLSLKNQSQDQIAKAQDELLKAKTNLVENKSDVRAGLQDQKFEASTQHQEAQQAFNEKKQQFKEALKSNNLTSMASDVGDAIKTLKDQVVKGSNDAYDELFRANGTVSTKPLINSLQGSINSMTVNGVPSSKTAEQAVAELSAMQDRLSKMGTTLRMSQAKQILQGLDKDINYSSSAGSFTPQADQALQALRSQLDSTVKSQVPAYESKMADVAQKTRLLSAVNDLYGSPEKAINNLNGITSEKGQTLHVPLLEALGNASGKDLSSSVQGYLTNHKILTTPSLFDQAIESIPEAKALSASKSKLAEIANPANARSIIDSANEPLANRVTQAQASLDALKERGDVFKGITPDSVTSKTKALNGANKYGAENRFQNIDKTFGTDFQKQIEARNDLNQFTKPDGQGSRKSLVGTVAGLGIGSMFGHPIIGAEMGAVAGASADKYSGQVFKYALDKALDSGVDLETAISRAKDFVKKAPAFATAGNSASASPTIRAADQKTPPKGPDKWANDGAEKLLTHDPASLDGFTPEDLKDPKLKNLLIQASDLNPGTKAMDRIAMQIKNKSERRK